MVKVVASKNELETLLTQAGDKLVVIDFYATWCGPCKMIAPKIEELSNTLSDVVFLKVDVDEVEDVAQDYNISAMPTFIFIKNKAEVDRFSGANFDNLNVKINKFK